eukprot:2565595-Ditylum_brightwellii.AAC.1
MDNILWAQGKSGHETQKKAQYHPEKILRTSAYHATNWGQLTKYNQAKLSLHHQDIKGEHWPMTDTIEHSIMTQYHVSKGLRVFGKEGTEVVMSEPKQLHERMVMEPKIPENMTK